MKIPKKYWKMTFNRWYRRSKGLKSRAKCGYCEYFVYSTVAPGTTGCRDCTIMPAIGDCFGNNSLFYKYQFKGIDTSKEIFTAIVADGRRLGYVGKQEEVKIKEVLG